MGFGLGRGVGGVLGVGRGVGGVLGLRGESVAARSVAVRLVLADAAGFGLAVGAESDAEHATPMQTIATDAAATGKREKRELRIQVSLVLIGRAMLHVRFGTDAHVTHDRPRCHRSNC